MKQGKKPLDVAVRTRHFRSTLIQEFRLTESGTNNNVEAPKHSSSIFTRNEDVKVKVLRSEPHSLIKFKIFKRTMGDVAVPVAESARSRSGVRVKKYTKARSSKLWALWLIGHPYFVNFTIFTIFVNAINLGFATGLDAVMEQPLNDTCASIDNITMVVFVVEILLRWVADFKGFWRSGWNIFDFFVTLMSLVPNMTLFLSNQDQFGSANSINLSLFSSVRTFRCFKVIGKFKNLRLIVLTVMEALQSLGFILLLLGLVMYIFSILAVNLFPQITYFSDFLTAFDTLFQLLTLDQWYNIEMEISAISGNESMTEFFFISWVFIGAFIFRNIFIGVMVKNFQSINQELTQIDHDAKKEARMQKTKQKLDQQFSKAGPPSDSIWQKTLSSSLEYFHDKDQGATHWPRDTLFEYLQTMELLQENLKEYQELQNLSTLCLTNMMQLS